ncbi:MAG: lipopolysaccharide transport system ATP-binding protein [Psychroserpens sp.]|jgi:lipopolysaccharide transport system ATP-binding protein
MSTVISLEEIGKQYRLGLVGTNTLRGDITSWWYRKRGLADPTLQIGSENRLDMQSGEYVWALRDINLDVKEGEILGIIGKNGAGKSTLLKILSRVTGPTTGEMKVKGRIASLLEVGTGFHPELTGRENIFLNGAILGMTKTEIRSKFEEIVDFSGVAKYIDTPVKRYSSGMYVRLAFAVAAHLDPEILIVDEVLAVGDAEFQKKAIGKMQDISKAGGRTVLFVSHNMASIKNLCTRAVMLENGKLILNDSPDNIIEKYLALSSNNNIIFNTNIVENDFSVFKNAKAIFESEINSNGSDLSIIINYDFLQKKEFALILNVFRNDELCFASTSFYKDSPYFGKGKYQVKFKIPKYLLNPGFHSFDFSIVDGIGNTQFAFFKSILQFEIYDDNYRRGSSYNKGWNGAVSPVLEIENIIKDE